MRKRSIVRKVISRSPSTATRARVKADGDSILRTGDTMGLLDLINDDGSAEGTHESG